MAVFDTHKAYMAFKAAGFTEDQAQVLIDQAREGSDELATRTDLERLELRMRLHIYAVAIVVIAILATLELLPL